MVFWWEGPDGSRLLTFYSAAGYGTGLMPPANWPYRTWLALVHTGDNHGPPTPSEVKALLDEAKQKLPGVQVRIGRLSDFADALLAEKADLPVVRGDMPDTWIHGPMCDPAGARLARQTRPAMTTLDVLQTSLGKSPLPDLRAAYEQSLLYGEHTWGGALYWVTKYSGGDVKWGYGKTWETDQANGRFERLETSWAEHTSYIERAASLVEPALEQAMRALALDVALAGPRVVIFNPLPWPRRADLASFTSLGAGFGRSNNLAFHVASPSGKPVAGLRHDQAAYFLAVKDVPAGGHQTYVPIGTAKPAPARVDEATATIEAGGWRAQPAPDRGALQSLRTRDGRELVDTNALYGFGQFLYERFDSNNVAGFVKSYVKIKADWAINELGKPLMPPASEVPYRAASPVKCDVRYAASPVGLEVTMTSTATDALPFAVTTRLFLYDDLPFLDLEVTVHNKPATTWPEAGWICLPFNIDAPQFRLGRLGGLVDPARDLVPGANHHLLALDTGMAVFDPQGRGMGLCAVDSPLVSLESPGCWKYSRQFLPKKSWVFINLFNNQWTTNFRLWNAGTWTSRVRLWTFDRFDPTESLVRPALEARYPLVASYASGPAGTRPTAQTGLSLSRGGVLLSAFGSNPDGPGTLLRLWEQAGQTGPCVVHLPESVAAKRAQPVDLRDRPNGPALPVENHTFTVPLHSFAPASYRLETEN